MPNRVFLSLLMLGFCAALAAAPKNEVLEKYHTPHDLYLRPQEAHAMEFARADSLLFIDVRTRAELRYVGMADAVDANIPVRLLRGDCA